MGLLEISYTSHSLVLLMFGGSILCVVLLFFFFYTGCGISSQQTSLKTFALYVKTKAGLRGLTLPLFNKCHLSTIDKVQEATELNKCVR